MSMALRLVLLCALVALTYTNPTFAVNASAFKCAEDGALCAETLDPIGYQGAYTGHDEPSLIFYSDKSGSGNRVTWTIRLPADPPIFPNQRGTAGTFNFQLHPAFFVGMVLCDDQSAPNPGGATLNGVSLPNVPCKPDSDSNIFDSGTLTDAHYIGSHPGTGFMEMQFYPPDSPTGCGNPHHPHQWCSALNIDSDSQNQNTGALNNADCRAHFGTEYVNFAYVTKSGDPEGHSALVGSPGFSGFTPDDNDTLFFNSGDVLRIELADTAHGLKIAIFDLTTGEHGSMIASAANGFQQVLFEPKAQTCTTKTADFHPTYATSSEHTRNTWTAHTYNIAFSDEIGHFEYCNRVDTTNGNFATDAFGDVFSNDCASDGVHDLNTNNNLVGDDDVGCFDTTNNTTGFVPIIGCTGTDTDFSGVPYQLDWPGTSRDHLIDRLFHPTPISIIGSPAFKDSDGRRRNYQRVGFETDIPRIEAADFGGNCNRTTGVGCTNPPPNANFYPIFTLQVVDGQCRWNLGGPLIPGTRDSFGGDAATQYGALLPVVFPGTAGTRTVIEDYRRILPENPCSALTRDDD